MDTLAGSFNLSMVNVWEEDPMLIIPNSPCSIFIDNIKVLTGNVDSVSGSVNKDETNLSVRGRCKTGDLVDSSIVNNPGSWKDISLIRLIGDLIEYYDINVSSDISIGENISEFTVNDGETIFEAIERLCNDRGVLPLTDVNGNLILTVSGNSKSVDSIIYGENILSAEVSYDYINRYSYYKVKGQKSGDGKRWDKSTNAIFGEAYDEGVERYRPKIITADGQMTNELASKRAKWEAQIRAGRSAKLSVNIPGWLQSNNSLWSINTLVYCKIAPYKVDEVLLLNEINYSQDENGTVSTLTFVRKDTYAAEPRGIIKPKIKDKKNKSFGFGW